MPDELTQNDVAPIAGDSQDMVAIKAEYERKYHAMVGRFNQLHEQTAQQNERIAAMESTAAQAAPPMDDPEKQSLEQKVAALQSKVQNHEDRSERLKKSAARQTIVSEMIKHGGDSTLVELAADSILISNGKSIHAVENDNGSYSVAHEDIAGIVKPISEFVSEYMVSEVGKRLIAPRATPNVGGQFNPAAPAGEKRKITTKDFQKLTYEEMRSGNYDLIPD